MTNNDESFLSASSSTSRTHLLLKRNQTSSTSTSSTTTSFFELPLPRVSSHLVESFKSSHTRDLINLNLFDFNAPYQARTLERDKISFRTQPASSSLSKSQLSQQQITNLTPTRSHPYMRATSPPSLTSSKSDTIKSSSSPTCGSSSNAILAQLKSISSNFKSIFVRPKTHKPIDASTLLDKPKVHRKHVLDQFYDVREPLLLSTTHALPRIELKELRINSSVDDILKKFDTRDDIIRRTIKSMSNAEKSQLNNIENSSTSFLTGKQQQQQQQQQQQTQLAETPSSSSSSSSLTSSSTTTSTSKQTTNNSSRIMSPPPPTTTTTTTSKSRWTCMICLSKHPLKLDVCSICGSSKVVANKPTGTSSSSTSSSSLSSSPTTSTLATSLLSLQKKHHPFVSSSTPSTSPSSKLFSSYLINELGLKHKLLAATSVPPPPPSPPTKTLDEESVESKKNPYIKKWTCIKCNCQNDSLKIVCMNCRWAKVLPTISNLKETDSEQSAKKSRLSLTITDEETINKDIYCTSCKSPIRKKAETTELVSSETQTNNNLDKPAIKWKCETCLVFNSDLNETCVCCSSPKPTSNKPEQTLAPIKAKSSKWTCDTCLVQNETEKTACVCCQSLKPGSQPAKPLLTTVPTLILPETNLLKQQQPSSSIKFGASTSFGSIKFDQPSSFKFPTQEEEKTKPSVQVEEHKESSSSFELSAKINFAEKSFKFGAETTPPLFAASQPSQFGDTSGTTSKPVFGSFFNVSPAKTESQPSNLFSFGKTTSTTTGSAPTLFSKPSESSSSSSTPSLTFGGSSLFSASTTPTTTTSATPAQTTFTPFGSTQSSLFSDPNKPSFSLSTNSSMPTTFSSTTTTTLSSNFLASQPTFPQFDFAKSQSVNVSNNTTGPTLASSATSFPILTDVNKPSFSFGSTQLPDLSQQQQQQQQHSLLDKPSTPFSFNPIIDFAKAPIVFSGNSEQGMNTSSEISHRRFRKAVRKNR